MQYVQMSAVSGSEGKKKPKLIIITDDYKRVTDLAIPAAEQKLSILQVAQGFMPATWEPVFKESQGELKDVSDIIADKEKGNPNLTLPLRKDLFNAFHYTPVHKVNVIILGQDPYPQILSSGKPRAQGLSFSVARNDEIPSSLRNIYKELKDSVPGFVIPSHGDLRSWSFKTFTRVRLHYHLVYKRSPGVFSSDPLYKPSFLPPCSEETFSHTSYY